jgi:hypothetical protein
MTKSDSDPPVTGSNAIWCRFTFQWRSRVVVVDRDTGLIEFRHCHVPRRFLARAQPSYLCSAADIKATYFTPRFRNSPGGLTVVTSTGKAFISERGSSFAELREWFAEAVPTNQPGLSTDNPAMLAVYLFGAIVGFFVGVFSSRNAGDTALVVSTVGGTVAGVIGSHLLVDFGGRLLKNDFAKPIGYVMVGVTLGAFVSGLLQRVIGWNLPVFIVLIVAGAVLGGMASFRARSVKKQMAEQNGQPEPPMMRDLNS